MNTTAVLEDNNRLALPDEAQDWFPPGTRFRVERQGDTVMLKRLEGLAAHFEAVRAAGNVDELSWEEIDREVQAVRSERANSRE